MELKEEFIEWSEKTPNRYEDKCKKVKEMVELLDKVIPKKLTETDNKNYDSFFNIDNIKSLEEIKKRLSTKGDLYDWVKQEKEGWVISASLYRYIKFLTEYKQKRDYMVIKNIILYGVPGVGKTHNVNKIINLIEDGTYQKEIFDIIKSNEKIDTVKLDEDLNKRVKFITFHQSFEYEDFIESFRPNKDGNIELIDGIFKSLANKAKEDKQKNYYLIIDEINRGNISKIFGELITLIEENKRDNIEIILPYSKEPFVVPNNLYIIGTMNSTDKSIALIDIALRRRFTFIKLEPNENLVIEEFREKFKELNDYITNTLGKDYKIGHSVFMNIDKDDLSFVIEYKIKPLLEEYYYGDEEKLKEAKNLWKIERKGEKMPLQYISIDSKCKYCNKPISYNSGPSYRKNYWSDFKYDTGFFYKCPHCYHILLEDEILELEEYVVPNFILLKSSGKNKEYKFKKKIKRKNVLELNCEEYYDLLKLHTWSKEDELNIRKKILWLSNDKRRYTKWANMYVNANKGIPYDINNLDWNKENLTDRERANILNIISLLDLKKRENLLFLAELRRELGEFDEAIKILNSLRQNNIIFKAICELSLKKYPYVVMIHNPSSVIY